MPLPADAGHEMQHTLRFTLEWNYPCQCHGCALPSQGLASETRDHSPKGEGALYAIALGVCDYLARALGCPSSLSKMPQDRSSSPFSKMSSARVLTATCSQEAPSWHLRHHSRMGHFWRRQPLGSDRKSQTGRADGENHRSTCKAFNACWNLDRLQPPVMNAAAEQPDIKRCAIMVEAFTAPL